MHPCKYKARIALAFAITRGSLFLQSSLSSRTLFAQTKSQQNRKQKQERKIQRALNKLEDADEAVLAELIRAGLDDLATRWPVHPS